MTKDCNAFLPWLEQKAGTEISSKLSIGHSTWGRFVIPLEVINLSYYLMVPCSFSNLLYLFEYEAHLFFHLPSILIDWIFCREDVIINKQIWSLLFKLYLVFKYRSLFASDFIQEGECLLKVPYSVVSFPQWNWIVIIYCILSM